MKKLPFILLLLLSFILAKSYAQRIFQKTYSPLLTNNELETLPTDDIIIAGTNSTANRSEIVVSKFNKCGNPIWAKKISADTNHLELVDLKVDQNQNAILTGHYFYSNGDRNIFLMSLNSNGTLNYFNLFDTGTGDIVYSLDVNLQNEILLYFKTNIGQAGPNSENTVAKLSANGQPIWIKEYGFSWVWGQMCATSDGGVLLADNQEIIKMDSLGNVSWNKAFEASYFSQDHFEIPGGYVFFRYQTSALNRAYACMIDYSGNVKWNSQVLQNFDPNRGILRKNGNLLFVGDFQLQASTNNPAFIEIDTSNGRILKTIIHRETIPLAYLQDLGELSDQSIFFSGFESLSFSGSVILGRINDTLSRVSCNDTILVFNDPVEASGTQSASPWVGQSVNIPLIEPQIKEESLSWMNGQILCEYRKPLSLDLGKDSTLCPGNSITLSSSSNFDGFLWSTNQRSASIQVEQAGTYTLKAWVDCDTISDTIQISYHQLPELDLGNDTTVCPEVSFTFFTNNGETAFWSTGDTAASITVDEAGKYWAEIPTVCGFIQDTVELKHYPELKSPTFENETTICLSTQLQLKVDSNATFVSWSTGETYHQIQTNEAGPYSVILANACDTIRDTMQLSFHPKTKINVEISQDTAKVLDRIFFRLLHPKNFQSIRWDFGDGSSSTKISPIHQYVRSDWMQPKITLKDSLGCIYDSSFSIFIQALNFKIPNVFTPNSDGINDFFEVSGKGIEKMQITIYNRWGELIYDSKIGAWDGRTLEGNKAKDGTYFYQIRFKQKGNEAREEKGSVLLIRERNNRFEK